MPDKITEAIAELHESAKTHGEKGHYRPFFSNYVEEDVEMEKLIFKKLLEAKNPRDNRVYTFVQGFLERDEHIMGYPEVKNWLQKDAAKALPYWDVMSHLHWRLAQWDEEADTLKEIRDTLTKDVSEYLYTFTEKMAYFLSLERNGRPGWDETGCPYQLS